MYIPNVKTHLSLSQKKSSAGFTLIEILIVFTVMSLLTGLGFAGFVSYSNKQSLDQAAFDLKAGIEQVKQLAVNRVKPAGFSGPLDRYRIIFCDKTAAPNTTSCALDPANNLYEIDALNDAGSIVNVAVKKRPSTVTITPSGCGSPANSDRLRFYILKASDAVGKCMIKVASSQISTKKTVCVDTGGSASIYNTDLSVSGGCP